MKVAILPFSSIEQSESLPVYRYFKQKNADITAYYWGEPDLPGDVQKIKIEPKDNIPDLDEFDLIVVGPAIHPRQMQTSKPITSLTNLFVQNCPTQNIIGITGTKGKGTTSTLIAKMLEANGHKVWLGGNIGRPLLDELDNISPDDWVVLEMSAGQLITFNQRIHIGVCLMVVPEHLDWHTDMDEYTQAKANLFKNQTPDDIAVYFANNENSKKIAAYSPGKRLPYFKEPGAYVRDDGMVVIGQTEVIHKSKVKLLGEHNLQNVCAAITTVYEAVGSLDPFDSLNARSGSTLSSQSDIGSRANPKAVEWIDKVKEVLSSFSGLEHRLELVRELKGIKYYDDSFGTTPETAIVALEAFKEPKVVILGGHDKGVPFESLAEAVTNNNVKHAVLIGDTAPKIKELLAKNGFESVTSGLTNMSDMVSAAREHASAGDVVLLSTGCASFGLFKDYKDRGNQFKTAVQALV